SRVSEDCRNGLARLDKLLGPPLAGDVSVVSRAPAGASASAASEAADPIGRLGFRAVADVPFRVAQTGPAAGKEYEVTVHLLQGALANPPVPFPLSDLRGQIVIDNKQIRFHDMTAQSGPVLFHVQQGRIVDQGESRPADFDLKHSGLQKVAITGKVRNPGPEADSRFVVETAGIPIDDRLRRACPEKFRNVIDQLQAEGDLEGKVNFSKPAGAGQPLTIEIDARVS